MTPARPRARATPRRRSPPTSLLPRGWCDLPPSSRQPARPPTRRQRRQAPNGLTPQVDAVWGARPRAREALPGTPHAGRGGHADLELIEDIDNELSQAGVPRAARPPIDEGAAPPFCAAAARAEEAPLRRRCESLALFVSALLTLGGVAELGQLLVEQCTTFEPLGHLLVSLCDMPLRRVQRADIIFLQQLPFNLRAPVTSSLPWFLPIILHTNIFKAIRSPYIRRQMASTAGRLTMGTLPDELTRRSRRRPSMGSSCAEWHFPVLWNG